MLHFCKRRGAAFRFLRITCSYLCFTFLLRALDWNNFEVNKYWLLTKCEVSEDPNVCLFGLRRSREIDERAKRAWLVSSRRERTNLVNKDFINAIKYTISSRTDQHWGGKMGRQPYEEKRGRDWYGTLWREAGFLGGWEGGEKSKTLILRHFHKQELRILFDLHLATSEQTSK